MWGWVYEEQDHRKFRRSLRERVRKGFLIDAENGTILKTMRNLGGKNAAETENEFSDFQKVNIYQKSYKVAGDIRGIL